MDDSRLVELGLRARLADDLPGAERAFREALALSPSNDETASFLGAVLALQGRLDEALPLLDRRRRLRPHLYAPAPLPWPLWTGQDVAGKRLLVWGEEGLGDQIMFARFARALKDRGADVTWFGQPALVRLFSEGLGIAALGTDQNAEFSGFDFYCPSSRLALGFGLTAETIPPAPYLDPPPPAPVGGGRFGIRTGGNPKQTNDAYRSLPPEMAAELLALPGAVDLAPEQTGATDMYETARIIMGLQRVITVDTSVAHLAGALGAPVWVLLHDDPDWRWERKRQDSPWYRSARLFRQPSPGDWSGVLRDVKAALAAEPHSP